MRALLIAVLLGWMSADAVAENAWGERLRSIAPAATTVPVGAYSSTTQRRREDSSASRRTRKGDAPLVRGCLPFVPRGQLSRQMVRRRIRMRRAALRHCYVKRLVRVPDLAGTVTVDFAIDGDGLVVGALASGSGDDELDECVRDVVLGIGFPSQANGEDTWVTYPLTFRRSDRLPRD